MTGINLGVDLFQKAVLEFPTCSYSLCPCRRKSVHSAFWMNRRSGWIVARPKLVTDVSDMIACKLIALRCNVPLFAGVAIGKHPRLRGHALGEE